MEFRGEEEPAISKPIGLGPSSNARTSQHPQLDSAAQTAGRLPARAGKPSVLHVITRLISGGADENTILTCNGLQRMGHSCTVVAGGESSSAQMAEVDGRGVMVVDELVREINPFLDLKALARLRRIIRETKPDIVHTHTAKAGVLGRLAARLERVPIVVHGLHGTTFHAEQHPIMYRTIVAIERWMARYTTAYVSVSNDLSRLYTDHGVGRAEQYATVRSGMDLGAFRRAARWTDARIRQKRVELGLPSDVPVALLVSRLEHRKRVDRFIEAAGRLVREGVDARFVVAGEGRQRGELEALAQASGLNGEFRFLGFRPDIEEVLAASSCVCLTSKWEGLPRVFVQATAVGRMIVCYDVNGAQEAIVEGRNGHIVPQDDDDLFCRRLREVLQAPRDYSRAAVRLEDDGLADWTVEAMVAQTAQAYESLMARGRLPERGLRRSAPETLPVEEAGAD